MDQRTKIFVIEHDCAKLVNLMLWLDQFPEFEIAGVIDDVRNIQNYMNESRPDVVLMNGDSPHAPHDAIASVRSLKANPHAPAIVVMGQQPKNTNDKALLAESDFYLQDTASITELYEFIRKTTNKRRIAHAAANMPKTKAG